MPLLYKERAHSTRIWEKIPVSVCAALVGILVANPTEVVKIRLQEQNHKQYYKGCINCYRKIFRTEGIKGFWSGVIPNLTRNIIDSPVEIATYYHSKEFILRKGWLRDSLPLHFICGLVTGSCTLRWRGSAHRWWETLWK
eukprot:TRINITY_DN9148_c0_g1_i4.p1 TRINITY_DN9148_c0_g1~~TRINITY_DN9148_c0_g1_i4.p1  ORF type:complete len:140 (-),score=13.25 TRINITY_DN9148_c0_g1_i4:362-781(-)